MSKNCVLYSDLHIKSPKDPIYFSFVKSLKNVSKDTDYIFLLGDIFNFLYGTVDWVIPRFSELFKELKKISKNGTRIYYVFGNHDFNFKFETVDYINFAESFVLNISDKKVLLLHGDGLDSSDKMYKFLKGILRSKAFHYIYKIFPCSVTYKLANFVGAISRLLGKEKTKEEIKELYRERVKALKEKKDVDILLMGHSHTKDYLKINNFEYFNSGEFVKDGQTILKI